MINEYLLNEQRSDQVIVRMYANGDRAVSARFVGDEIFLTAYTRTGPRIYNIDYDNENDWNAGMSASAAEEQILQYLEYVPDSV
jgi:uncharacterized secreted protein with C-terminal beta-propeller domain